VLGFGLAVAHWDDFYVVHEVDVLGLGGEVLDELALREFAL
jgi:hypothetical protein